METLLKTVGYGALLIVLSPFIALALLLFVIYTILNYVALELTSIFRFFSGKSFKNDDKETIELNKVYNQEKSIHDMQVKQAEAFANSFANNPFMNNNQNTNSETKEGDDNVE